ncbi:MAG: glycosyltransferase [Patescibacteria group bacterium]
MKVSIVILDFEKSTRVVKNVESIFRQKTNLDFEIVIAVNRATAQKKRELEPLRKINPRDISENPRVKLIFNKENLGYPRGVNEAVKNSSGEILFIVNPDIMWRDENALAKLVNFLERNPKIGVLAPQQRNDSDGKTAQTIRAFPKLALQIARRTWLRRLPGIRKRVEFDEMRHLDFSKIQKVDWLQSSFWVVRRDLWEKLNGLDERFFLFMSDPDFCWRVWDSGKEVIYFPEVVVAADGIRCSAGGFLTFFKKWTLRQHLRDAWKYFRKYRGKKNPRTKTESRETRE